MQAYAANTGQTPEELQIPPLPAGTGLLWQAFLDLNRMRPAGMGASPIPASELLAYQQLHDIAFNAWELECLQALDGVALKAASATSTPGAAS